MGERQHVLSAVHCAHRPYRGNGQEIQRAVKKGHKGVVFPAIPMHLREVPHINEPVYDPVWATCQDLAVPVAFMLAPATRAVPGIQGSVARAAAALAALTRPVSSVQVVANFLYSRILMRYPTSRWCLPKAHWPGGV